MAFVSPLGAAEREDLRWYLEDYQTAPFAVYELRGQAVREQLAAWGEALFEAVFGAGKPGGDAYQGLFYAKVRKTTRALLAA